MNHLTGRALSSAMATAGATAALPGMAADPTVVMNKPPPAGPGQPTGPGEPIRIAEASVGATFKLGLHGLPLGPDGFHVRKNASCPATIAPNAPIPPGAARGHPDPDHAGKQKGPAAQGHSCDLPVLEADGSATQNLIAPRPRDIDSLPRHARVIHVNGNNSSDPPAPLDGGRVACGVIG